MSDKPKTSFLKTLGKHLVVGSESLPAVEPTPPVDEATQAAADKAAADKAAAEKAEADKLAAEKAEAEKLSVEKTAAEKAAAEKAELPPPEPKAPKPKKSEPLPPVAKDDFSDPVVAPEEPKSAATLLDYQPTRAEVRYLDVLQSGAQRDPAKYQSILDREVDRLKKVNQFAAKWREEHPDEELTPEDPEYRKFLRAHPPAIDATEHEELRDELVADKAKRAAKAEMEQEMQPKLRKVIEMETKPEVAKAEAAVEAAVLAALPESLGKDDYLIDIAKAGMEALTKVPAEGRVFATAVARGRELASEFIKLKRGVVSFDAGNSAHVFISRTVATAAEHFEKLGGAERFDKSGRRFVSPAVYGKLRPEARDKHWTFTDSDVVDTIAQMTARGALDQLKENRAELQAHADFRKPKTPAGKEKPAAPAEPPKSSPAVGSTPAGSSSTPPPPKNSRIKQMLGIPLDKAS